MAKFPVLIGKHVSQLFSDDSLVDLILLHALVSEKGATSEGTAEERQFKQIHISSN